MITTPATRRKYEPRRWVAASRAMRSARPVLTMAAPRTKPLKISQKADDANPEKIVAGGAIRLTVASAKNKRPVRYSGSQRVANRLFFRTTIAESTITGAAV